MSVYKNILIAVDVDGGAEQVLGKALALFSQQDVGLTVLNVVDFPFPIYDSVIAGGLYAPVGLRLDESTLKENRRKQLIDLLNKNSLDESLARVECGRATNVILDVVASEGIDLIIIGSHGKHGAALLLGSTATGVLHRAAVDVLAVSIHDPEA